MKHEIMRIGNDVKQRLSGYEYPNGYSPDNALIAAKMIFEENNNFPQCTEESIRKCILGMLVQGLNPLKKQCYFIPYKNELQLIRDYSGAIMVAQQVEKEIWKIRSKIVKDGDQFDFEIENGMYRITKHKPTLKSLNGASVAAYAIAVDRNEKVIDMELMNYDQYVDHVRINGKRVKGEPIVRQDGSFHPLSNHAKYPDKMFAKTVIHQLCRRIIKSSPNEEILSAENRIVEEDTEPETIITETAPGIETIDFDEKPNQATDEQCKAIFELEKHAGREKDILKTLSEHFGRSITGLKQLTSIEASSYINRPIDPEPEPEDEQPPWK